MREIFNEGRVVGLSTYELYVRQLLSMDPEATPMTEREWLAATLSNNMSMILRVPSGTTAGYHDYVLPEGSELCGATVIYGSVFEGEVWLDETATWATKVTDYGRLISNTEESHPVTPGTPQFVPTKADPVSTPDRLRARYENYLKVSGALLIQPGTWVNDVYYLNEPYSSLQPDFTKQGFVRLSISSTLTSDVYILLHGFMDKVLLNGEASFPVSTTDRRPESGDFLGPTIYPWGCPIILIVNSEEVKDVTRKLSYLGTLHTVVYCLPLEDETGDFLLTEDGQILYATKRGTVAEMWQRNGIEEVLYVMNIVTEDGQDLVTEYDENLLAEKVGTMIDMEDDGGFFEE